MLGEKPSRAKPQGKGPQPGISISPYGFRERGVARGTEKAGAFGQGKAKYRASSVKKPVGVTQPGVQHRKTELQENIGRVTGVRG